ncbi:hypothetical protein RHMOL_Rhmol10G0294300 [Rhododendron molle]|uniref:Uncharacterized protein n=2 Tax=Rhododendron molle TaxID=49168 RepID=A0ACC0M8M6_RHOML|nr:hypothetical protein RHMOL_Rhmol10G0294100 [Rhododendron molle]KAI8536919.1 hypothetical protein RHMOL_Rhmol10G0294300 [Rhododendron molle]
MYIIKSKSLWFISLPQHYSWTMRKLFKLRCWANLLIKCHRQRERYFVMGG